MAGSPYDTEGLPAIRAGAAERVITPELPVYLAGYFHDRLATRVRDELYCHAVVLETGGGMIAIVGLDLASTTIEWADPAREMIAERTGIPADNVLICSTHTHTGPAIRRLRPKWVNDQWLTALPGMIADTVVEASEGMFDAVLCPGTQFDDYLANNRVVRRKDATEIFNRGQDDTVAQAGPIDPEIVAMAVRDMDGQVRAMLVNYAIHSDVIGGGGADFVSADWPGEVCRVISAVYGDACVPVFLQGPSGDLAPRDWGDTRMPLGGEGKAMQIGRSLAGLAISATEEAEPMEGEGIEKCGAILERLEIPYVTRTPEMLAEAQTLRERGDLTYFEQAFVDRIEGWTFDGEIAEVPVQVLRIGELVIVAYPSEIFCQWGLLAKHFSPGRWTMVVELANGSFGYIPTTDQAGRDAYGAKAILSRQLVAEAGRMISDASQRMAWELWDETEYKPEVRGF